MQYALLIHEPEAEAYPDDEAGKAGRTLLRPTPPSAIELAQAGVMRGGAGLKSSATATTVKVTPQGRTVHDGPFAETANSWAASL